MKNIMESIHTEARQSGTTIRGDENEKRRIA